MVARSTSSKTLDNLEFKLINIVLLLLSSLAHNNFASEIRGKPYSGEFHFVEIRRKAPDIKDSSRCFITG